jgi:hypothetical protein
MTTTLIETPAPEPDPIAEAITALTAAARRERTIGAGTPNEHTEHVDFGEIACHVITAVAANVGGVEVLLSGRPGSWEADYVRQIVQSTAGDDDAELLRYRTEPVRIEVDVEDVFYDFGLTDLYERDVDELATRAAAAAEAVFEAYATPEERARIGEIQAVTTNVIGTDDALFEQTKPLMEEAQAIVEAIAQRATAADDPLAAALAAAEAAEETARDLWEQDQAAYREAYTAAIRQALTDRGLTVEVEVVEPNGAELGEWNPLVDELHQHARKSTPLPMSGAAPDWTDGTPADALHRAGLTYIMRAQEAAR